MFTGKEFIVQLDNLCKKNGTTIGAFLQSIGKNRSLKNSIEKANTPNYQVALAASERFSVPLSVLLGTENELVTSISNLQLSKDERDLITSLRSSNPIIRDTVLRMVDAALNPKPSFLSPNDRKTHHEIKKDGDVKFLKHVEGDAAAGVPITAVPEDDLSILVPEKYLDSRYFIVRARGESMADHIPNGAYCVFQRDAHVDDGSIVLVQIDSKTDQPDDTIKRIYRMGKDIELRSDNPAFAPMRYPTKSVRVTGVFVDVLPRSENV